MRFWLAILGSVVASCGWAGTSYDGTLWGKGKFQILSVVRVRAADVRVKFDLQAADGVPYLDEQSKDLLHSPIRVRSFFRRSAGDVMRYLNGPSLKIVFTGEVKNTNADWQTDLFASGTVSDRAISARNVYLLQDDDSVAISLAALAQAYFKLSIMHRNVSPAELVLEAVQKVKAKPQNIVRVAVTSETCELALRTGPESKPNP